jgi:hypothetical protein
MSARIIQFPNARRALVKVERVEGEWSIVFREQAWPCTSREVAVREAHQLAIQLGAPLLLEPPT